MTLIENLTLTGEFTIKETRSAEEEIFSNSFLGGEYNFPSAPIRFEGNEDGFSKLTKKNLPVDKDLDLISNLENLKKQGLIEDYIAISAIKENDYFVFTGKITFDKRRLLLNQKKEPIWVNNEIFKILESKKMIVLYENML